MRKMIWCGVAGCTLVAGSIYSLAQLGIHYPETSVGQMTLAVAGRLAGHPTRSYVPEGVPVAASEEPCEVVEEKVAGTAEPELAVAIVIPEDEAVPAAEMPVRPNEECPVQTEEAFAAETEFPAGEYGPRKMEYAEEEACEELPMPKAVEPDDGEEQEETGMGQATGSAGQMLRLFEKLIRKAPRPEASAPTGEGSKEALRKIRAFKMRMDEFSPAVAPVDTMEFRASDRALYDFGPGSL
ncbi:MAG: hypothetical protein U0840_03400 [Gemmataceae bacterium]